VYARNSAGESCRENGNETVVMKARGVEMRDGWGKGVWRQVVAAVITLR
jgi:hypothetical protein